LVFYVSQLNLHNTTKMESISVHNRVDSIKDHWQPEHLMTVDSSHTLKIAKVKGSFIWHSHPNTDEVFYCVSGGPMRLEISTKATSPEHAEQLGVDHTVELRVGDMFKVPQGVQHRPIADVETGILMIERVGTVNTGDCEGHALTAVLKGSEV
jgi:mannose-6-phosphate isomerase-like protein (cupin superfamily)